MAAPDEEVEKIGGDSEVKAKKVGGFLIYIAVGILAVLVIVGVALLWRT